MNRSRAKDVAADARTPDAFLTMSERVLKWIEENIPVVTAVVTTLFLFGGGWAAYQTWVNHTEAKAAEALHSFELEWEKLQESASKNNPTGETKPWDSETMQKADEIAGRWTNGLRLHKGKVAASLSAMKLASEWSKKGNHERALSALEAAEKTRSNFVDSMVALQKAGVFLDLKEWQKSVDSYQEALNDKSLSFAHDLVLLRQGLAFAELGESERARANWQRIRTEFSEAESSEEARSFLRLQLLREREGSSTKAPKG